MYKNMLKEGAHIASGQQAPKQFGGPENLKACNKIAIDSLPNY